VGAGVPGRDVTRHDALPLVGRVDELATVRNRLARLGAGVGSLLMLVGEPGVGKSRLLAEARRYAANAGFAWLEGHTNAFGRTISYPGDSPPNPPTVAPATPPASAEAEPKHPRRCPLS